MYLLTIKKISEDSYDSLSYSKSVSQLGILAFSNALGMGILGAFWLIAALITSKSILGELSFIISISTIGASFATLGFSLSEVAIYSKSFDDSIITQFNSIALLLGIILGVFIGILIEHPLAGLILVISQVSFTLTTHNKLARKSYLEFGIWIVLCSLIRVILGILSLTSGFNSLIVAISYGLPSLLLGYDFIKNALIGLSNFSIEY